MSDMESGVITHHKPYNLRSFTWDKKARNCPIWEDSCQKSLKLVMPCTRLTGTLETFLYYVFVAHNQDTPLSASAGSTYARDRPSCGGFSWGHGTAYPDGTPLPAVFSTPKTSSHPPRPSDLQSLSCHSTAGSGFCWSSTTSRSVGHSPEVSQTARLHRALTRSAENKHCWLSPFLAVRTSDHLKARGGETFLCQGLAGYL